MASKQTKTPPASGDVQSIEQLQQQYEQLNTQKIRAESDLSNADKELRKLQAEATDKFGTHDIAELETRLKQMEEENEQRRAAYQTLLEGIVNDLEQIEAGEPKQT